jgi:anti-repressor protein
MSDLIPILKRHIGDAVNAVDARELHRVLGANRDFSNWVKARIADLDLVEGLDFEKFNDSASPNLASANRIDYAITLDAAKHIALSERTQKGREVRAYFIECEKKLRAPALDMRDPRQRLVALNQTLELLAESEARVEKLEATVSVLTPKAETHDALMESGDTLGFRAAVKVLHRTTAVTEREVRTLMVQRGWIQRLDGVLMPASYGEQRGYVTTRVTEYTGQDGEKRSRSELRVTNKGVARLQKLLTKQDAA